MQEILDFLPPGETRMLPMSSLSLGYAHLRVAHPKTEAALERSLSHLGQISPIAVSHSTLEHFELLDGFKRVRILTRQGRAEILARILPVTKPSVQKSLMFSLHGHVHGLSELEEALIVQSLYQEEKMSQTEIAVLLARHKSWVCRRIALLLRLAPEVREHLVLGLVPLSVGRILCQLPSEQELPRGNGRPVGDYACRGVSQEMMLACILKHRLSQRECEALQRHLKNARPEEAQALLWAPWEIEPPLSAPHGGKPLDVHLKLLCAIAESAAIKLRNAPSLMPECILLVRRAQEALERCRDALRVTLEQNTVEAS